MDRRKLLKAILPLLVTSTALGVTQNAQSAPGRPASPGSVAGVRRRTRRRTRRRVRRRVRRGMRLSYLPYGCNSTIVRAGATYYYCGGIYYQPVYSGTTVVYVVDEIDAGANTNVEFEEEVWE